VVVGEPALPVTVLAPPAALRPALARALDGLRVVADA
jgi:hypothetical protein